MSNLQTEVERVRARDQAWIAAESADEVADNFLADDITMMAPGMPPVHGREDARKWYEIFREPLVSVTGETLHVEVAKSKDLAFSFGVVHLTLRGDDGDYREDAKYMIVYRKVGDEWKGVIDIFTGIPIDANITISAGSKPSIAKPSQSAEEASQELWDRDMAWLRVKSAAEVDDFLTDDVVLLPPDDMPICGREAALEFYEEFYDALAGEEGATEWVEISEAQDLGFTRGTAQLELKAEQGTFVEETKYAIAYRREDGVWKGGFGLFNPNAAAD
jgi:ketosteroid isomerase-like protein